MTDRPVNHDWATWLVRRMRFVHLPKPTDLAKAAGVDQSVVSRWINEGRTPQIEQLRKVAGPLQTDLPELLVRSGQAAPQDFGREPALEVPVGADVDPAVLDRIARYEPEELLRVLDLVDEIKGDR